MRKLAYFLLVVTYLGRADSNCSWNPSKDLSSKDPVLLKKYKRQYHLYESNSTNIELKRGQVLYATCPGDNNAINGTDQPFVKISCEVGKQVKLDGNSYTIDQVGCVKNVAANILALSNNIPGSEMLTVGFNTSFGWMSLFNISYNFQKNIPLYSRHYVNGKSLQGYYNLKGRPGFKTIGVSPKISWNKVYTKNHQNEVLASILGKNQAKTYLDVTFVSRGHLSPDADFYYKSWQFATYFYANVVPQWQSINAGNWERIENAIRNKAKELQERIEVMTGSVGLLTIKDDQGVAQPIYLDTDSIPVPKFIWKIACSENRSCISFIVSNDPINGSLANVCENLCQRNKNYLNWHMSSFDVTKKGLVACCDVRELMQTFPEFPTVDVRGLLRY